MSTLAIRPRTAPFRTKSGLMAALAALLSLVVKRDDNKYTDVARMSVRNGKHSGRNPGAFGGPNRAKKHRKHYLAGSL